MRHDLPPLLSRILCGSLLCVDDLFSVFFLERLCISFSRCSSLDICLFTYAFSSSLSRSFILTSFWRLLKLSCAFFAIRFTPFTSCLLWSYCLFLSSLSSLKTLAPRTWIIAISTGWQSFSSADTVALRCTKVRHSSMRTSWSSSGVSWRTLMGYPNYERNRACALPSSQALPIRNG